LSGPYRQSTIVVTSSSATTVSGYINGVLTNLPKAGAFTVAIGGVCPLLWSADGSRVWAIANEQAVTADPGAGSGSGSNPGGVSQGATTYAAVSSGQYRSATGDWAGGSPTSSPTLTGAFFYGASRFRELQGRTVRYCRAYLPGSNAPTIWGHPHASRPAGAPTLAYNAGARALGGWVNLPVGLASYLISGTGTGGLAFTTASGLAQISGLPYGQIEIGWRI
jgi:hypothetical protein